MLGESFPSKTKTDELYSFRFVFLTETFPVSVMAAANMVIFICFCGETAVLKTSWTDANLGRRFVGCKQYGQSGACRYFAWYDPPVSDHERQVIVGLLRKIRRMEMENTAERKRER